MNPESLPDPNSGPFFDDSLVGILTSTDRGLSIGLDPKANSLYALITQEERDSLRLGHFLDVPFFDEENFNETLLCKIIEVFYHNEFPHEFGTFDASNLLAEDLNQGHKQIYEGDYNFIAKLEPLSIVHHGPSVDEEGNVMVDGERNVVKDKMFTKPARRLPLPASRVYRANEKTISTGLKLSKNPKDIFVGYVSQLLPEKHLPYRFKETKSHGSTIFTHVLVTGGTGSGKTQATKNILRQCLSDDRTYEIKGQHKKLAIVQFDPQDEYAQMCDDGVELPEDVARRCEENNILVGQHEDTRVFVPDIGGVTYDSNHSAEKTLFSIPFSLVEKNHWLITRSGLSEHQLSGLIDHILPDFFNKTPEKKQTYSNFLEFVNENKDNYVSNNNILSGTYDAIKRRVSVFNNVFSDSKSNSITGLIDQFVEPGRLSVVPTSHINNDLHATFVVLALSSLLIDNKLTEVPKYPRIKETPLLISMDEAHNFLSTGNSDTEQGNVLIQKFINAAKQGRKERLGLFLVTQDPHDIAADILTQINTMVILNLNNDSAIRSLKLPTGLKSQVPNLTQGDMVIHSPTLNSIPIDVTGLPHCLVRHSR
jgi:DNA helicase HerA-like ATPase